MSNGRLFREKICVHFHMCLRASLLRTLIAQVWHPCLVSDCGFHANPPAAKHMQLCEFGTHPGFHFYPLDTQVWPDAWVPCAGLGEVLHPQRRRTFVTHFKRSRDCPCPCLIPVQLHSLNDGKQGRWEKNCLFFLYFSCQKMNCSLLLQ